jgi:RNA polymerase sigma-70 factor (ECF subfamily)
LLRSALERVRTQVRENTWRAFVGTALEGRPAGDLAEELGMTPGAVRVARSRVLQRLRSELGDL